MADGANAVSCRLHRGSAAPRPALRLLPPSVRELFERQFAKAAFRSPAALDWNLAQPVVDSIRYEAAAGNAHPDSLAERAFGRVVTGGSHVPRSARGPGGARRPDDDWPRHPRDWPRARSQAFRKFSRT